MNLSAEVNKRRTFAIISHPDAGKTTLTEKLLLFSGAIQLAGTVKGRQGKYVTSDALKIEQERGISVTSSVMQFIYNDCIVNLLDTPGHEDFSEDTYRTLTAVDSALMVIDAVKGVEARTIKLMEVCRMRDTPILTFINKMDREGRPPIELLDEIERILKIRCAPVTWPLGQGRAFKGIYHLLEDAFYLYSPGQGENIQIAQRIEGLNNPELDELFGDLAQEFRDDLEFILGVSHAVDHTAFLNGELTPVFFGSAMNNFGVKELLDGFVKFAPPPRPQPTNVRLIEPTEEEFSGFVFKIQANMDPNHRDRIAFLRICSGHYERGIKIKHLRIKRDIQINQALTFMASDRNQVETAFPGDIIGLHNHGTIQVGDSFSSGESIQFSGIPHFAPELFRRVRLKDPMKLKALQKGLVQLSEEGATQVFKPLNSNDLIVGAVGVLQFDVVAHRLKFEYNVECAYDAVGITTARWIVCDDYKMLEEFKKKAFDYLAMDGSDQLAYLAPTNVNLNLAIERWPKIQFLATREIHS